MYDSNEAISESEGWAVPTLRYAATGKVGTAHLGYYFPLTFRLIAFTTVSLDVALTSNSKPSFL